MPTATFYLIAPDSPQDTEQGLTDYLLFLVHHFTQQGLRMYLQCQDKEAAEQLDDYFWQAPVEHFIAHHLVGESGSHNSLVEIGYLGASASAARQLFINLANSEATFAHNLKEVIDFVTNDEQAKLLARARYKQYRQAGYHLQTLEINHLEH